MPELQHLKMAGHPLTSGNSLPILEQTRPSSDVADVLARFELASLREQAEDFTRKVTMAAANWGT